MSTRLDEEYLAGRAHVDAVRDTSAASTACARCSTARSTRLDEKHRVARHVDAVRDTSAASTACARYSTARSTCLDEKHLAARHVDAVRDTSAASTAVPEGDRRRGRRASTRNTSLRAHDYEVALVSSTEFPIEAQFRPRLIPPGPGE